MTLAEMRARLEAIETERREIHTAAGDNALGDEQQTRWDALDTEENELREQIRPLEEAEQRASRVAASRARWGSTQVGSQVDPFDGVDVARMSRRDIRDRSRKLLEDEELVGHLGDDQRARLQRLFVTNNGDTDGDRIGRMALLTSREEYRSAFAKLATRQNAILSAEEARAVAEVEEYRAMSIGTDPAGGFAVPVVIDPTIILTAQGSPNDILRLARVETITNDVWRGLTSAGVTWTSHGEGQATTDNSPTIAQPEIPTVRADATIPFSIEVSMDWPAFAAAMTMLLGEGYDEWLAQKLTTGVAASNEPVGLVTRLAATTASRVASATAGAIAPADVYGLWAALPARFRRGDRTAWMSSTAVQNGIRQFGTTDPNFTMNIAEGGFPRLFGKEYPANDFMAAPATGTAAANELVVGDFRHYLVAQRAGMSIEFVPHLFDVTNNMPTGQRAWFAWARVGADVLVGNAFRLLQNKTA